MGPRNTQLLGFPFDKPVTITVDHSLYAGSRGGALIPGSVVGEANAKVAFSKRRRILYLHVIGVRGDRDVERQRESILLWEERIVRAVGSRVQIERVAAAKAGVAG